MNPRPHTDTLTTETGWVDAIRRTPPREGQYPVRFHTGFETVAYWTGTRWVDRESQKDRRNNCRHLSRLLKYWRIA